MLLGGTKARGYDGDDATLRKLLAAQLAAMVAARDAAALAAG